jgi:small conductance mechanosensitive channel
MKVPVPVPLMKDVMPRLVEKGLQIAFGIVLLLVAHFGASIIRKSFVDRGQSGGAAVAGSTADAKDKAKQARNTSIIYMTIGNIIYYTVMIIAAITVLRVLGIEAASIIALIGATGFAIGLALQGTLSDISSGILLAMLQLYSVGDIIQIDDMQGEVKDFTLLHTIIEDLGTKAYTTIPNRKIQESVLINHTRNKTRVVIIDVLVSNKNKNYEEITREIRAVVEADPKVSRAMIPAIGVESMSEVGTLIRVKFMISSSDYPGMIMPVKTRIRQMLADKNIEMTDPF